jgi:preprotein translocase subunit SecF
MYPIIQKRKIWLSFSALLVTLSIAALAVFGLNLGIDFTGGALLEVRFIGERPTVAEVEEALGGLGLNSLVVQPVEEQQMILRFQETNEDTHQAVVSELESLANGLGRENNTGTTTPALTKTDETGTLEELRFDAIGPSVGDELKQKSVNAVLVALIVIVLYIAWAFRRVSKPVASWKYGITALITLFHDVIITLGVFAVAGEYWGLEVNTPFVAALLTVLGYSVNDTIVVFDRIREVLPKSEDDFEGTINTSVNSTITRSINTSITTLIVLVAILFFGGESIQHFMLALAVGVFFGTYSSIFLASPVLVEWEKRTRK